MAFQYVADKQAGSGPLAQHSRIRMSGKYHKQKDPEALSVCQTNDLVRSGERSLFRVTGMIADGFQVSSREQVNGLSNEESRVREEQTAGNRGHEEKRETETSGMTVEEIHVCVCVERNI